MNKIIIIGNLGRDPEMRYSPSGTPMTSFSVASNRRYTTAGGEQREETEWFNCTAFGRMADVCNQYLTRGQQVYVEGRLRSSQFTRRDGTPGFSLEVTVNEMQMLGRRDDQQAGGGYGGEARGRYDRPVDDRYAGGRDSGGYGGGGGRDRDSGGYGGGYGQPAGGGGYPSAPSGGDDMDVDDLPF